MLSTNWARELLPTPPWETIHIDIPRLVRHEFTCASREPSLTALSSSLKPWIALIMQRTETSHLIIDKFSELNYPAHSKTEAAPLPLLSFHSSLLIFPLLICNTSGRDDGGPLRAVGGPLRAADGPLRAVGVEETVWGSLNR